MIDQVMPLNLIMLLAIDVSDVSSKMDKPPDYGLQTVCFVPEKRKPLHFL